MRNNEAMMMARIDTIPLADAVLCCDCEVVSKAHKNDRCVICGSDSTLRLSLVVGAMARAAHEYVEEAEAV